MKFRDAAEFHRALNARLGELAGGDEVWLARDRRSIAFGPHGAWVLLFDKTGVLCGNVPDGLGKVFDAAIKKGLAVRCVCFTTSGTWICLTDGGWWTSDLNHPASKMIAELEKQHHSLHWVAVAPPEIGPHDFQKWAAVVHRECDGKLPGGCRCHCAPHRGSSSGQWPWRSKNSRARSSSSRSRLLSTLILNIQLTIHTIRAMTSSPTPTPASSRGV